ncbi:MULTISPECIES: hypothetical protein [unclassified Streptomyces]|uniref:hypothetical protein n=1 Tax=unclassified Streptomyces TaxID=2593676 RepID=UPI0018F8B58A|nr:MULTISPECIES: hypothetical protein [unclassified Streptomyces]
MSSDATPKAAAPSSIIRLRPSAEVAHDDQQAAHGEAVDVGDPQDLGAGGAHVPQQ